MNKFLTFSTSSLLLLLSAFLITSCGGGGGGGDSSSNTTFDGNTAPAAIDSTNAQAIGESAGEGIQKADASLGLPGAISISTSADMTKINNIVLSTANILNSSSGITIDGICDSGSASSSDTPDFSGPVNLTLVYDQCVISGDTFDGTVKIHYDDISDSNAGFTFSYINFTVKDPINGTTTINMTLVCTDSTNCTINSDFVGSDGTTNRMSNFSISGNASTGFSGSATFFNGTYGKVSITFTNITYGGSCGGSPNGGNISFSSTNGSSGTIIFNSDCSVSGTWNNGTTSGSF